VRTSLRFREPNTASTTRSLVRTKAPTPNFFNFDARLRVTDALTLTGQLGNVARQRQDADTGRRRVNTGVGSGAGWNMHGISSAADWNLGTANIRVPAGVGLGWIFGDQNVNIKDKEDWTKLDGEYALDNGILSSLQFGARYNEARSHLRRRDRSRTDRLLRRDQSRLGL